MWQWDNYYLQGFVTVNSQTDSEDEEEQFMGEKQLQTMQKKTCVEVTDCSDENMQPMGGILQEEEIATVLVMDVFYKMLHVMKMQTKNSKLPKLNINNCQIRKKKCNNKWWSWISSVGHNNQGPLQIDQDKIYQTLLAIPCKSKVSMLVFLK